MGIKVVFGLLLAGLIVSCSIPLGMTSKPRASLVLKLDGLPTQSFLGSKGRLVTPDTSTVTLLVRRPTGEELQQVEVVWDSQTGSATAALTGVPLNQPIVFEALARSAPDTEGNTAVTARGNTSLTLVEGENVVPIFLFPEANIATELTFGIATGGLTYASGEWGLWKFDVPAAPAAFSVTFPKGTTAYLQAPSGPVTPLYVQGTSVASEPGTWNLLIWNRSTTEITGPFATGVAANPTYGYTLDHIKFPDMESEELGMNLEIRLYDRPYYYQDKVIRRQQSFQVAPGETVGPMVDLPSWNVGPQDSLVFVLIEDGVITGSGEVLLETPPTSPGQTLTVYSYAGWDEGSGFFVGRTDEVPAPSLTITDGTASWAPMASATMYELSVRNPDPTNNTAGGKDIEGGVTSLDLSSIDNGSGGTYTLLPYTGTSTYQLRAIYLSSMGLQYGGPFSAPKQITAGPDVTAPTIVVTSPGANSSYMANETVVYGNVSDNVPLKQFKIENWPDFRYRVDGGTWSVFEKVYNFDDYNWNFSLMNLQTTPGVYDVEVKETDSAGNESVATRTFTIEADIYAPSVSMDHSLDGATKTFAETVTLSGTMGDNVGVSTLQFFVNGAFFAPTVDFDNNTWTVSIDLSTLGFAPASYPFMIVAYDYRNNSANDTINITLMAP